MDLGDRRPLELLISISTIKVHRLAAAWLHDHGCMALCGRLSHGHPVMLSCYASRSRRPLCTTDVLSLFAALGQLLLLQSHPSFCCRCRHERASARAKADPQPSGRPTAQRVGIIDPEPGLLRKVCPSSDFWASIRPIMCAPRPQLYIEHASCEYARGAIPRGLHAARVKKGMAFLPCAPPTSIFMQEYPEGVRNQGFGV